MPHQLTIDRDQRLLRIEYTGSVPAAEILGVIEEMRAQGGFPPGTVGLSDFRFATLDIDPPSLRPILDAMGADEVFKGIRWAMVMDEPRAAAIGMLYRGASKEIHDLEVFTTIEAAYDWLRRLQRGTGS